MKKRYIIAKGLLILGIVLILGPLVTHKMHNEKISKKICISEINGDPVESSCPKEPMPSSKSAFVVLGVFSLISITLVFIKTSRIRIGVSLLISYFLMCGLCITSPDIGIIFALIWTLVMTVLFALLIKKIKEKQ